MLSLPTRRGIVKSLIQLSGTNTLIKTGKCLVCKGNIEIQCTVNTEVVRLP